MKVLVAVALVISFMAGEILCEEALSANLALFRESPNVGQSSKLYSTTGPEHATDGRIDSKNVALHSITGAISADPDPYWFVKLDDMYLVQTVEVFRRKDCCFYKAGTLKVLVGESLNGNAGVTNPQCGNPKDMLFTPKHIFRCEVYGQYVTIKKKTSTPLFHLSVLEVMVNKEPTPNIALGRPTSHSSLRSSSYGSSNAVDGQLGGGKFVTNKAGVLPHWMKIDFGSSKSVHKIIVIPRKGYYGSLEKIIITLRDDATDNGKHNTKIGAVHDFSKKVLSMVYLLPVQKGRYFYFESLLTKRAINLIEIEIHSESMPYIMMRSYEPRLRSQTVYQGNVVVLTCPAMGFPRPLHIAWLKDGVLIQNKTVDTYLKWTVDDTLGSNHTYACEASNIHGKDYYPISVIVAGRYDMCMKPEEIRDSTRSVHYKQNPSIPAKSDATFDGSKMHSFFNPLTSLNMKMIRSCPPPSSCGTAAPGWLTGAHPQPEEGIVRRRVCFHYNGNCCFKATYVSVINCPGVFLYALENTAMFAFPARYCFEDDKNNEGYLPFRFVSTFFTPVGDKNAALVNHVIATEHGIEDSGQCLIVCMMTKCRSLNYDKTEKICEVNDVTKDDYPRDLSAKAGFHYYHPMKHPVGVKKYN